MGPIEGDWTMRSLKAFFSFVVAAIAFNSLGAAPHIDERLHLTIKGELACQPMCGEQPAVILTGLHLGDPRAETEIASANVSHKGGAFLLIGTVLIGYQGQPSVPPSERTVALEVRSRGCSVARRTLVLKNFVRDKYGYLLDIGTIKIYCGPMGS
jgi:hypothetical protein